MLLEEQIKVAVLTIAVLLLLSVVVSRALAAAFPAWSIIRIVLTVVLALVAIDSVAYAALRFLVLPRFGARPDWNDDVYVGELDSSYFSYPVIVAFLAAFTLVPLTSHWAAKWFRGR